MAMSQEDIRAHYEGQWSQMNQSASDVRSLAYSSPIEDAVVEPIYRELLRDVGARSGAVLDVGAGAGRWVRNLLDWFEPERLLAIDATAASAALLSRWCQRPGLELRFLQADITHENLELGERFDLINVANVLFHIPEEHLFAHALANLARHLAPGGHVVTTEYLPRAAVRTEWMLVRSRYVFEEAAAAAGLRVVSTRATGFFANDPMGLEAPGTRAHFSRARQRIAALLAQDLDEATRAFLISLFADVERALLAFCQERIPDVELPAQKLVALTRL